MNHPASQVTIDPYYLLRASLALFQKTPDDLSDAQQSQAEVQARNEFELESRVLSSAEAAGVIISDADIDSAVKEIRARFEDDEGFEASLVHNGLDPQSLQQALQRQCKVEQVLERIASRAPHISDVEIGIFYHMHPEKFRRPEQRSARHILLTINDDYPENTRENALKRINEIAEKLQQKPGKFPKLAMQHSECPTAMHGGDLGTFVKGQLFPEIEAALFELKANQISEIVETEVGFHIVQCTKIHNAETMSLQKASPKIRQLMEERARRNCQRAWLASLPTMSAPESVANLKKAES